MAVDRTRVRAIRLKVEIDEPDGSITEVEVNGFLSDSEAKRGFLVETKYADPLTVLPGRPLPLMGVHVRFDCLLSQIKGEDQDEFPLYRMTEGMAPQAELTSGVETIRVLEAKPSKFTSIFDGKGDTSA